MYFGTFLRLRTGALLVTYILLLDCMMRYPKAKIIQEYKNSSIGTVDTTIHVVSFREHPIFVPGQNYSYLDAGFSYGI